jgi:hypothetical protein
LVESIKQEVNFEPAFEPKIGSKFVKINDFDPNWQPGLEEVAQNQTWLAESGNLAEKIGQSWPSNLSAVDAILEDR